MKTRVLKLITLVVITLTSYNTEAQLLKRLKDKVNRKIEQKVDEKVDKTLEDLTTKKPNKEVEKDFKTEKRTTLNTTTGSAIIKHTAKYDNFNIEEFGKATLLQNNKGVRIYGSWVTQAADIQDGYVLVIPNGNNILFDKGTPKQEQIKLRIPEDATLELSYDPIWDASLEDENGFSSAVTTNYQSYNLESGEIIIDVLREANIQISFSGEAQLVTRTKNTNPNSEKKYILSYTNSSINGAIDVSPISFIDNRTIEKSNTEKQQPKLPNISKDSSTPGIYNFNFETLVKVTNMDDNETYNISYLLNPNTKYIAIKADMSQYSDEEIEGESIIVMDDGDAHIFVETQGMKMRMSSGMMGNKQQKIPTDQMANYDYTNLTKTGNTKTVLGANCFEYVLSDDNVKMELWVAPEVNLPNWFIQNDTVLKGHIMEYTITSKDGNMKSEIIAINDNINKIIDSKEYKKMF